MKKRDCFLIKSIDFKMFKFFSTLVVIVAAFVTVGALGTSVTNITLIVW